MTNMGPRFVCEGQSRRECPDCIRLKQRIAQARWDWWRRHLERKLALHQAIAGAGWP